MSEEISTIGGLSDPAENKAAAEQVVQKLLDSFTYEVTGGESLEEIIALARDDWDGDAGFREARGQDYTRAPDDRLAVDFLRHQRTDYDDHLNAVQSGLFE